MCDTWLHLVEIWYYKVYFAIWNSVPFEIVPSCTNALGPAPLPLPETVFEFFLCEHLRRLRRNSFNLFYASPWTFFNVFLTFKNAKKSRRAISGEYGECNIWVVPFFTNQLGTTCDICGGALSWRNTQLLAAKSVQA